MGFCSFLILYIHRRNPLSCEPLTFPSSALRRYSFTDRAILLPLPMSCATPWPWFQGLLGCWKSKALDTIWERITPSSWEELLKRSWLILRRVRESEGGELLYRARAQRPANGADGSAIDCICSSTIASRFFFDTNGINP